MNSIISIVLSMAVVAIALSYFCSKSVEAISRNENTAKDVSSIFYVGAAFIELVLLVLVLIYFLNK